MGIIKRLLKVVFFLLLLGFAFIGVILEAIYYGIRWIITGKEFREYPISAEYLFKILES